MLGDLPSIVPRRNYDIRTQCLKGTCSSSELPGRWHVPVLDDACPCRGCSSMFSPEASTWKGRLQVPLLDQIHCFGFPDRADDGVRTRGFLLWEAGVLPLHHIRMAVLFSDTSHGGDVLSASRKRDGWLPSERPGLARRMGLGCLRSPTLFDPSCQWSRMC